MLIFDLCSFFWIEMYHDSMTTAGILITLDVLCDCTNSNVTDGFTQEFSCSFVITAYHQEVLTDFTFHAALQYPLDRMNFR